MIACITLKTKMYSMHFKTLFYDLSGVNEELEIYKQTVLLDFYVYPIISSLVIIFITHYLFQKTWKTEQLSQKALTFMRLHANSFTKAV